jgi:hypothetical protein
MTPKEKAIELIEKFEPYVEYQGDDCFTEREKMLINAKQCALIAVDEIINEIYKSSSLDTYYLNNDKMNEVEAINYYKEVKQEIEKL